MLSNAQPLCLVLMPLCLLCFLHTGYVPILQSLQGQHDELEKAFRKERAALEEKYAKLYGESQQQQQFWLQL
jgi:hypothetical protein